jgi:hypothetical protein
MDYQEEQDLRRIGFVASLTGGEDGYPPQGWHSVEGPTGRSALIWSLCKWRADLNGRATLVLPMAEPYDYRQVAVHWAGLDDRMVIMTRKNDNLLKYALWWMKSGLVGQVVMENLGFLLGAGTIDDDLSYMLGPVQQLWEMRQAAEEYDVALYTTSYAVRRPGAPRFTNEQFLGGPTLLHLTAERRILLVKTGNRLRAARRAGEFFEATNALNRRTRKGYFEIMYQKGPVRLRQVRL